MITKINDHKIELQTNTETFFKTIITSKKTKRNKS
jgi:hypothetical protein